MPSRCSTMVKSKDDNKPRRCKLSAVEGSTKCFVHKGARSSKPSTLSRSKPSKSRAVDGLRKKVTFKK